MSHKFTIGQRVRFSPGTHERAWAGVYTVVARLPEERGAQQYKIESVHDHHQRVVLEFQISAQ